MILVLVIYLIIFVLDLLLFILTERRYSQICKKYDDMNVRLDRLEVYCNIVKYLNEEGKK